MPTLARASPDRELERLIRLYLKAENNIINEIGRLRSRGLVDYHAVAALERVQAILRRTAQPPTATAAVADTPALSFGALSIDAAARTVKLGAEEIELTAREFDLLHTLAAHPGHIYTRESLLSALWGYGAEADTRTVDVHVQRLRTKLRNDAASGWNITTVWGVGYRFDSEKKAGTESC